MKQYWAGWNEEDMLLLIKEKEEQAQEMECLLGAVEKHEGAGSEAHTIALALAKSAREQANSLPRLLLLLSWEVSATPDKRP